MMKLLSLHIRNFGNLSDYDYSFKDGINSFIQDNGSGKSTLAAFLKAMLYGMDGVRSNDKDFKDRKHYAPYNRQSYGGTLELIHQNDHYRIEKTFDVKSDAKDEVKIYKNKELLENANPNLGEELLGLDKSSFERLLFISYQEIEMASNGNIKKNLNNIIDNTIEGVDYDHISSILMDANKEIKNQTKSLKENSKLLEEEIKNQKNISLALESKYKKRNDLYNELDNLKTKQNLYLNGKAQQERLNNYQSQLTAISKKDAELQGLLKQYPNNLPNEEEIKSLSDLLVNRQTIAAQLKSLSFDETKKNKLDNLSNIFREGTPTDEEINNLEKEIDQYNKLDTLINNSSNDTLSKQELDIKNRFKYKNYDNDLNTINQLGDEYTSIENRLKNVNKYIDEKIDNHSKKKSPLPIILLVLSIIFFGAGIGLIFVLLILGIILLVMGLITIIFAMFLYFKNKMNVSPSQTGVSVNKQYDELHNALDIKEKEIKEILVKYQIYHSASVHSDIEQFKNDYNRYQEILAKENSNNNQQKETKATLDALSSNIKSFFDKYHKEGSFNSCLNSLKEDIKDYINIKKEFEQYHKKLDILNKELGNISISIRLILDKYQLSLEDNPSLIDQIKLDNQKINNLNKEIKELKQAADNYQKDNNISMEMETIEVPENIDEDILKLSSSVASIDHDIEQDEIDIESLEDNEEELDNLRAKIKELDILSKNYQKTMEILDKAQKNLDDKYVSPIMDKFSYYSHLLGDILNVKIEMGRNFDIKLNINGELKDAQHLSAGQMSICALCFRLALLDNIYSGHVPFIIMDDPFVNLDDNNLKQVKELLKNIGNNMQILYLSCHKNREL